MPLKKQERLINPFLLIGALSVVAVGLAAGFFLTREPGPEPPVKVVEKETPKPKTVDPKDRAAKPPKPATGEAQATPTPSGPTRIRGFVVDKTTGIRAEGITVKAGSEDDFPNPDRFSVKEPGLKESRTNANGEFLFDGLRPGSSWILLDVPPRYATVYSGKGLESIQLATGEHREGIALQVVQAASLAVTVNSAFGKSVPGAKVQVYGGKSLAGIPVQAIPWERPERSTTLSVQNPFAEAIADENGHCQLTRLEPGAYDLIAFATGFARQTLLQIKTGTSDAEFKLEPEVRVTGTVNLARTQKPLAGALVEAQFQTPGFPDSTEQVVADASGVYWIRNLPRQSNLTLQALSGEMESSPYTLLFRGSGSEHRRDLLVFDDREITGKVVDAYDNSPVQGATIEIQNRIHQDWVKVGQTDPDGWFTLKTGLWANRLRISKKGGYKETELQALLEGEVQKLLLPTIRLVQGVDVSGRVVDGQSKVGLGNVRLFARNSKIGIIPEVTGVEAQSDAGGKFVLKGVPPGEVYLTAEREAYLPLAYGEVTTATTFDRPPLKVYPGTPIEDLLLELKPAPLVSLSGSILSATGGPIPGAAVSLILKAVPDVTSGEDGAFKFTNVPFGSYSLAAEHPGYFNGQIDGVIADATSSRMKIDLILEKEEKLSISGKVVDDQGQPVAGSVTAILGGASSLVASGVLDRNGEIGHQSVSGGLALARKGAAGQSSYHKNRMKHAINIATDGTYRLEGLRPGVYTLGAIGGNFQGRYVSLKYDIQAGATGVDFTLASPGAISGTVLNSDGQTPVPLFEVSAQLVSTPGLSSQTLGTKIGSKSQIFQSPDGVFEFKDLSPGIYTVSVVSDQAGEAHLFGIEVGPQGNSKDLVVILNGGGFLFGNVVDKENKPIGGAKVYLGESVKETFPEDGGFEFAGLAPDTYALLVTHPDYAPGFVDNLVLQEGMDLDTGDLQLGQGGALEGRVSYANGAGGSGYALEIETENSILMTLGNQGAKFQTTTDPAGYFRFDDLGPGKYRLILRRDSGEGGHQALQALTAEVVDGETTPIEFVIGEGVRLSGSIQVGGQALARSSLSLFPRFDAGVEEFTALTDAFGRYSFEGVPPGPYEAVIAEFSEQNARNMTLNVPNQPAYQHDIRF